MTLFIKTYKNTNCFGTKWVCQPINLGTFDYEGGASDDCERNAISKCFQKYRSKGYKTYYQTERNGKTY
jgi:hypothetical protein